MKSAGVMALISYLNIYLEGDAGRMTSTKTSRWLLHHTKPTDHSDLIQQCQCFRKYIYKKKTVEDAWGILTIFLPIYLLYSTAYCEIIHPEYQTLTELLDFNSVTLSPLNSCWQAQNLSPARSMLLSGIHLPWWCFSSNSGSSNCS